jgi:hypothetical protein
MQKRFHLRKLFWGWFAGGNGEVQTYSSVHVLCDETRSPVLSSVASATEAGWHPSSYCTIVQQSFPTSIEKNVGRFSDDGVPLTIFLHLWECTCCRSLPLTRTSFLMQREGDQAAALRVSPNC